MSIKAIKKGGMDFEPLDEGAYPARIYRIVHIGTVMGFQGQMQNKVNIAFEFPTELKVFDPAKGEQPYVLSQDYTLSFHEKSTLYKVIMACDPTALKTDSEGFIEEYDVEKLLGKTCLVTVTHKKGKEDKTYANIGNCTVMPKGMTCPEAINETKVLNYDNFDHAFFMTLPQFLRDKITSSDEYKAMDKNEDEQIPF